MQQWRLSRETWKWRRGSLHWYANKFYILWESSTFYTLAIDYHFWVHDSRMISHFVVAFSIQECVLLEDQQ